MSLVSVNITSYNREQSLMRCLESVTKQSYKNIEINIVDDCSTDNTEQIVKFYQEKDNRINYFKHEINKGNAFSRNTALKNSNGIYVAFMDDDDEWIDDLKLEKQVEIFQKNSTGELGLVCSSIKIIREDSSFVKKVHGLSESELKSKILSGNSVIYNSTVLVLKSIMDKLGGFDEDLPRGIDSDFFRRLILIEKKRVFFMDDVTANIYECGADRMTNVVTTKSLKKNILANEMCLIKYKEIFSDFEEIKKFRKNKLLKKYLRLLYNEPSLSNIGRMIKGMSL
mgnify:CR=1 FL=1